MPSMTLLTAPPSWLGGGTHLRQMSDVVRSHPELDGRVVQVGSLRGGDVDVRLPAGVLRRLGPVATRALGGLLWRGSGGVHRASIEIPPAPREIISVLDLAPRHFPDEGRLPRTLLDQVRRARGVVVSTRLIADEVRAELGAHAVWLVPPAVEDRFFTATAVRAPTRPPYVLHIGGATRRKGLDRLAAAWPAISAVEPELELVLAGPPHPDGRAALVAQDRVSWLGQLEDDTLLELMRHARAIVVPSSYEGFGMPVAEAMALGTPVVVLSGTAPAEVGGDVAHVAAADGGAEALAEAVLQASTAREGDVPRLVAGRLRAQGWSLGAVGAMQVRAYEEAFG